MDVALTPLEFARRTRALYPDRDALVDVGLRLNYAQFFARCDRWSAALQGLGVAQGDRVAYIAPNTHAQLESFYAVPQIGAVLVPINYRLSAGEFEYIVNHSGATVVCAHADYLECLDDIRAQLPNVRHFVALEGARPGWIDYEKLLSGAAASFDRADADEQDDVAAEGRDDHAPQRVHQRRRDAAAHPDADDRSLPVDAADVPRERLDVRVGGDGRRRRAHLPAEGRSGADLPARRGRARLDLLRRADGAHRRRVRAAGAARAGAEGAARGHRRRAAGRGDDRARGR